MDQLRIPDGILVGLIDLIPPLAAAQLVLGDLPEGISVLNGVRFRSVCNSS